MVPLMARPSADRAARAGGGYPLVLDGASIEALIVGGGAVAARKAEALLAAGARVRLVAPHLDDACGSLLAGHRERMSASLREYRPDDIGEALLVIAATDDAEVNAAVARDARERNRLANVADAGASGNCITPAAHHVGPLTIAVSAGGVPGAAARIRDAIAERFDSRYADALEQLGTLRDRMLQERGRQAWRDAAAALIGSDFCDSVERGTFRERVAQWR